MTLTAPTTATGSTLLTVDRGEAGHYQRSLATLGHRLPLGWDAGGWRSREAAGYDLLLATPRTLSALGWFLMGGDQSELGRRVPQAHREAARVVTTEFAAATGRSGPNPMVVTLSSAATIGSPSRQLSGSRPGSEPSVSIASTGMSTTAPISPAPDPRGPSEAAQLA